MTQDLLTENDVRRIVKDEIGRALWGTARVNSSSGNTASLFIDGEQEPTRKMYKTAGPYRPVEGERVMIAKCNGTYVILGRLD